MFHLNETRSIKNGPIMYLSNACVGSLLFGIELRFVYLKIIKKNVIHKARTRKFFYNISN